MLEKMSAWSILSNFGSWAACCASPTPGPKSELRLLGGLLRLYCAVLCCAVRWCAVLCCAVLHCAVLCCARVWHVGKSKKPQLRL